MADMVNLHKLVSYEKYAVLSTTHDPLRDHPKAMARKTHQDIEVENCPFAYSLAPHLSCTNNGTNSTFCDPSKRSGASKTMRKDIKQW